MARDTDRYVYLYVGIPRDSETYQKLLADADETGLSVPKVLAVRIADFYRQLLTSASAVKPTLPHRKREEPEGEMDEDLATLNANAVLDEWG